MQDTCFLEMRDFQLYATISSAGPVRMARWQGNVGSTCKG